MLKKFFAVFFSIILILLTACTEGAEPMKFNDESSIFCISEGNWTEFFNRTGTTKGWLCADGIYSVALNGNDSISSANSNTKTLFIFSDTLIGSSDKVGKITSSSWANHSAAVLEGNTPDSGKMTFYYGLNGSGDMAKGSNLFGQNQWLFDMFVFDGSVFILAFTQESWKPVQIDIIEVPISEDYDPLFDQFVRHENIAQLLKKTATKEYAFGMGIMNNTTEAGVENADEYIYFYGYRDNIDAFHTKDLIVARLHKDDFRDFSKLRYWNGTEWGENIEESAILIENVSCEASVTYMTEGLYKGKYLAIYTQNVESERIMCAVGDSPVGPFSEQIQIYTTEEHGVSHDIEGTYYTYNAKAHPHLSEDGSLLISYNVNVKNGSATKTDDYHPRFIEIDWD